MGGKHDTSTALEKRWGTTSVATQCPKPPQHYRGRQAGRKTQHQHHHHSETGMAQRIARGAHNSEDTGSKPVAGITTFLDS
jgi:hypothetical protein